MPTEPLGKRWSSGAEREFFIDNLLVRIHFIIVMIRWTGLAPWEFQFPFPGSLTSNFLASGAVLTRAQRGVHHAAERGCGRDL